MKFPIFLERHWRILVAIALGAGLALTGVACDDSDDNWQPPKAKKRRAKQEAKAEKQTDKTAVEQANFSYVSINKRDPFRSYLADMDKGKDKRGPLADTERFDLSQYRLTAVVSGTTSPRAMVEDPDGVGHVLKMGSKLGKNGGRVTRISSQGIRVIEEFRAPTGQKQFVPIDITLPDDDSTLDSNVPQEGGPQ
jgi:type IV pilus assembly protein PilP